MKFLIQLITLLVLSSCTISVSQVHTEGVASDVVDETQSAEADIHPDFSLPLAKEYKDVGIKLYQV